MHYLVTLEPFSTAGGNGVGYCLLEINHYVAQLRDAVYQYFRELDGQ